MLFEWLRSVIYVRRWCDVDALLYVCGCFEIYTALEKVYKALACRLNRAGVWYMATEVVMLMHSCVCMAICMYVDFFRVYMWLLIVV